MKGVRDLDLYMYAGKWYGMARNANPWQKDCTYAVTRYYVDDRDIKRGRTPKLDFESDCINSSGEVIKTSKARVRVPDRRNMGALKAKWENSLEETWMVVYDTDYVHYTIEGDKEKKYLWIMSRSPEMCIDMMRNLLVRAKELGFDIEGVEFAPDTLVDCPAGYYENEDLPRDRSYSPGCGCGGNDEEDEEETDEEEEDTDDEEEETEEETEEEDLSHSPGCGCGIKSRKQEEDLSYGPRARGRRRGRRRANRRNE